MKNIFLTIIFMATVLLNIGSAKACYSLGATIPGVPNPANVCCEGLQTSSFKTDYNEDCTVGGNAAGGYAGICIACGDGQCDESLESKCNCPQDCNKNYIKKAN